jgi:nucleoside-diphosphate-sugar epimerase
VIEAATAAGVRRIVHIGTVDVYDAEDGATFDESCPKHAVDPGRRSYRQQKLAAENLLMAVVGGPEVVCLQPAVVYGPWSPPWTVSVLEEDLRTANNTLPTGPDTGVCNALHVHDLSDAIHFVATAPGVDHREFLVTGPDTISWGEYYDAHRRMAGVDPPEFYDAAQSPDRELYASRAVVSAERLVGLGFRPRIGVAEGLDQVERWAKWARLL